MSALSILVHINSAGTCMVTDIPVVIGSIYRLLFSTWTSASSETARGYVRQFKCPLVTGTKLPRIKQVLYTWQRKVKPMEYNTSGYFVMWPVV
ncbi:hypothetical protein ACJMK2_011775 [Sinanodonta woodiana]|uniref:Uncharacterized protein n=1 Tax=Sinanodonta woodiana TaxID=1069815 RepID=A0ABD3V637_SINWO